MDWIVKPDGNLIVSNAEGMIIYLNETAIGNYHKDGGATLIGKNLMDCHNENSRRIILEIMTTHQKNVYTIDKRGKRKIIYQAPWLL